MLSDVYYPGIYANRLKITAVGAGDQGGTIELDANGLSLQYTPAEGFVGVETFTYTIITPDGLTDTATVTVRVGVEPEVPATVAPLVAPPERLLASEFAPIEWTATETSVAEVALPIVGVDRLPVARSVAAQGGRRGALSASHSVGHPQVSDLLNLSLRRSASAERGVDAAELAVVEAADEAFADMADAASCCDELAGSLAPNLARGLAAY
jgi:hypothetical protein